MSDVKDEIDLVRTQSRIRADSQEWAGEVTSHVQTKHWHLGVADYLNSQTKEVEVPGDTFYDFHTYTIDWQEDYIRWLIDGVEMRRVDKADTLDGGV
jgi:beta-glucanase (GH16 family)